MKEELSILVQAQYPLIYLVTYEEERSEQEIVKIAQNVEPQRRVFVWTLTQGVVEFGSNQTFQGTQAPQSAVSWMMRQRESGIFIFKDMHPFFEAGGSPEVIRSLRDAIVTFRREAKAEKKKDEPKVEKTIVLMSPVQRVPIELEKEVAVIDFALPSMGALDKVLDRRMAESGQRTKLALETREKLVKAALGLTEDEAEKVYRKAQVTRGKLTEDEVEIVLSEKKQLVRRNGILEYIEEDETIDAIGGLGELKQWVQKRTNAFTERARQYGLPHPKGLLILGIPGCGKSLLAKTTSRLWGLPLLRLDMGRVFDGSTVGKSEANLRAALKTVELISPAILLIEEIEKAFGGVAGSADSDGGTSSRIFGSFLTWMQEKESPVFVMATANRVHRLPAEFLRKGRFDEIFFVDLPNLKERQEIFRIHLSKRRRDIKRFDLEQLANVSDGFSGAEIEQAIIAAMYEAFAQGREFTQLDTIAAMKATQPLSKMTSEQIDELRRWAQERARPASGFFAEYQRLES